MSCRHREPPYVSSKTTCAFNGLELLGRVAFLAWQPQRPAALATHSFSCFFIFFRCSSLSSRPTCRQLFANFSISQSAFSKWCAASGQQAAYCQVFDSPPPSQSQPAVQKIAQLQCSCADISGGDPILHFRMLSAAVICVQPVEQDDLQEVVRKVTAKLVSCSLLASCVSAQQCILCRQWNRETTI